MPMTSFVILIRPFLEENHDNSMKLMPEPAHNYEATLAMRISGFLLSVALPYYIV